MRKSMLAAGVAALALVAGTGAVTGTASAAAQRSWRVTYVSPDTGYDDFGLYDVAATGANDAWAVGSTQQGAGGAGAALHWNGTAWTAATIGGAGGSYHHVDGTSPHNVWITGATDTGAGESWHWDGTTWSSMPLGDFNAADIAVLGPSNVWAVGNNGEGSDTGLALHWNGTVWKTVAMPFVARKVEAVSAHDVWAVGENATQPLAAHWDGTSWKSVALPTVPIPEGESGFAYFNDLVALASDDVWAVGRLYWGGGEEIAAESEHNQAVLMHWDGHAWKLTLGPEGAFALSAGADGEGGIWYSTNDYHYVHVASDGTTTTVPVPTPAGRTQPADIRQLAGVPGGTTVLAVGQAAPAVGDESWDAVVEQYH